MVSLKLSKAEKIYKELQNKENEKKEIVGHIIQKDGTTIFKRGCPCFNHHECVEVWIQGEWRNVRTYMLGYCLCENHPNFLKPCSHFKLEEK